RRPRNRPRRPLRPPPVPVTPAPFWVDVPLGRLEPDQCAIDPAGASPPQGADLGGEGERVVAALGGQDAGAFGGAGVDHRTGAGAGVPGAIEEQSQLLVAAQHGGHGVVDDGGRDVTGDQAADGQSGGGGRTGRRGQDQARDYVPRLAERGQYLVQGL